MSPGTERTPGPRIAVVGAGWAGLAAAWKLKQAGWRPDVFEQAPVLGGRARKALIPRRKIVLDNGQHLMLGAYRQVLALMQDIGIELDDALLRLPLQLTTLDNQFGLRVNSALPGPLRLPLALLRLKGLTARDKFALCRALFQLQVSAWRVAPDQSVQAWLDAQRQPPALVHLFWTPLCVATLNTPIAQASMALFAGVLKDSLGAGPDACDLILPRVDLSALWPQALTRHLRIHTNASVRGITRTQYGYTLHSGQPANEDGRDKTASDRHAETFDAVVLATPPLICHRLLAPLSQDSAQSISDSAGQVLHDAATQAAAKPHLLPEHSRIAPLLDQLQAFRYHAIATLTVFLAAPFPLADCMYMLNENRELGHDGQWLFNRSRFMHQSGSDTCVMPANRVNADDADKQLAAQSDEPRHSISIVISHADHLVGGDKNRIADAVLAQVHSQLPDGILLPAVLGHELIIEKRATFAATPGLARPGTATPWPGLFLAGDWTDTGYPAVLEGAVMSGIAAAQATLAFVSGRTAKDAGIAP